MEQIFGNFIRYDADQGFMSREDIKFNSINVEDLEGCLLIFRVKNEDAYKSLKEMWTDDVIADIGCSVMILKDDDIAGVDIIDIPEAEKITLRQLDPELERRAKKAEEKKKNDKAIDKILKEVID